MHEQLFLDTIRPNVKRVSPVSSSRNSAVSDAWGVRRKDLDLLSYGALASAFYGLHNVDVPVDMLTVLNPAEIVAIYVGTGILKKPHGFSEESATFSKLVGALNRQAFPYIDKMVEQAPAPFGTRQRYRLAGLNPEVKTGFTESFFSPYRFSDRDRSADWDFHDPNVDGRSRKLYINAIRKNLKAKQSR